jgi:transcriptional regulator with XRE-family HTH domain
MEYGRTMQSLRNLKSTTQEELAQKLGITQQMVSKLEKQQWINPELVREIVSALKSTNREWDTIHKLLLSKTDQLSE